jgi:uncharacterized repeat protein (TIGR01451 family)
MSNAQQILFGAALLFGAAVIATPQGAMAANSYTPACTQINNTARINFKVNAVDQTAIDSNTRSFYVGVKVDVIVVPSDSANVTVSPGSAGSLLTFTVTNNGNAHQKYALSIVTEAAGVASPFSGTDIYDATLPVLSAASIADLAPDAFQVVTISAGTPLVQTNGQVAVYALKAQTQWVVAGTDVTGITTTATGTNIGGTVVCTNAGVAAIDVVVADGAGAPNDAVKDGAHSARDAYQVAAATLTITKSSAVYWDPVNLFVTPKAIPGAVITYTITIANAAGGATATDISTRDDLSTMMGNLTFGNGVPLASNTSFNDGVINCSGTPLQGIVVDGVCKTNVFAGGDGASWNDPTDLNGGADRVSATGITVAGGGSSVIKYQVTIR